MKILSAPQIKDLERASLEIQQIDSIELMERAAKVFTSWFVDRFQLRSTPVYIFCGLGNNGGDGLAISRLLSDKGYSVHTHILHYKDNASKEFLTNEARTRNNNEIFLQDISEVSQINEIPNDAIIIDAILGIGLNKPLDEFLSEVITKLNQSNNIRIAVDVPTGFFLNKTTDGIAFQADYTVTFQAPKLAMFFPESFQYCGEWSVLDIGLDTEAIDKIETNLHYLDAGKVTKLLKNVIRKKFDHKGIFGHALIIAGSKGKIGASILASKACLRTGAGLVTAYIPKCGIVPMQTNVPEIMVKADSDEEVISKIIFEKKYQGIAIGPGLGQNSKTVNAVKDFLYKTQNPLVIDADAINIIAKYPVLLKLVPDYSLLTPHPKEFSRLLGDTEDSFERLKDQLEFSKKNNVYILLKGAFSCLTTPLGEVYFNSTGNPGMATAGSGDVLTGMITSLFAQGYSMENSAIIGMYLHGLAGDFARDKITEQSMIASDIIDNIGFAYKKLLFPS